MISLVRSPFVPKWNSLIPYSAVGIILACLAASCQYGQAQAPGALSNADFERWDQGLPVGWSQERAVQDRGTVSGDSAASSGSRSLKLSPNSKNTNENEPYGVGQEILVAEWAGRQVQVSLAMRESGGAQAALVLLPRTADKQVLGMKILWQRTSAAGFERQSITLDLAPNVKSLILACATPSRQGSVWFDDIRISPPGDVSVGSKSNGNPPPAETSGKILYQNSFEHWSGQAPAGWVQEKHLQDRGRLERDASGGHSGQGAVKLSPNSKNKDPNQPYGVATIGSADELRGRTFRIEAYLKREGEAVPVVLLLPRAKGGKILGSTILSTDSNAELYELRSAQVSVPPDAHDYVLALAVTGQRGSAWFDDVRMVEGGESAEPDASASTRPSAPVSTNASMKIDAERILRDIPHSLYGYNLGWVWNGEGAWDEERDDFNQAVLSSLRALDPGPLRFPQGTYTDFYHWRDGVGPRKDRPVRAHGTDENRSKNLFGTDEFLELCARTGAEPMLQVNIISGTPQEAADWVAYCNRPNNEERIRNGHSEPYDVRLWEIGNEPYLKTEGKRVKHTELTPAQYVERYREFARAMKAVDPTIRLGAVGGKNFDRYQLVREDNWNDVVLKELAAEIDFFAVHNAYGPVLASQSGASLREIYAALAAFPEQIARNLDEVNRQIERYAGSRADEIQIAITEWGPLFHVLPSDPYVGHPKTLGSALFVAAAMQKFIQSERTGIANFFKATEHAWMSAVANDGAIKATGFALKMFADNFGERLVSSEVESPVFDTRSVGNVAAESNAPYVTSIAALSADGSKLYLMAVNKNFDYEMNLELEIEGFDPRPGAKITTLTGPALDAHNGEDFPKVAGIDWARQARAPDSAWDRGKAGLVSPVPSTISNAARRFTVELPPMSVTSVELIRK